MKIVQVEVSLRVTLHRGAPFVESRARLLGDGEGPIPWGKVLVTRTPILPPGASDEEVKARTERELLDDDAGRHSEALRKDAVQVAGRSRI